MKCISKIKQYTLVPKHLIWVWKKTMVVLSQTISYHTFLIIPNRYENPAPGMKTAYLGMKWIPRVWKVCMKVWKIWQMLWNQHTFEDWYKNSFNGTKQVHSSCSNWSTQYLFHNQKWVKICIVDHYFHNEWTCFVLLKLFLYQAGLVSYHWNYFCTSLVQK